MHEKYDDSRLVLATLELLERDSSGREKYHLEPGDYQVDFGFQNFGEHEAEWLVKASDNESDWEKPFTFDFDNLVVKNFADLLFQGQSDFIEPIEVKTLAERFGRLFPSMSISEPESFTSLSEIVAVGRGTCAAKSVLFGSLVARYANLDAQAITGQYGQVKNQVSYPFHHQWIRINHDDQVYLFDPMYDRFAAFEEQDGGYSSLEGYSYFQNLTPGCYPVAKLISDLNIRRYGGQVRLVKSYRGDSSEVYVENEESVGVQLSNSLSFAFEVSDPKELVVHDGAIKTSLGEASIYFPINKFQKI